MKSAVVKSAVVKRGRDHLAELVIGSALLVAFAALRLPLFSATGAGLGWNSDAAIFGLMARAMAEGRDVPLFFWGQSYLGTITSLATAAVAFVTGAGHVGPRTLRVAVALEVLAGVILYWLAFRRSVGRWVAGIAAAWLIAGPAFLFFFVIAPIGAEQLFLTSALLFWFSTRADLIRPLEWFTLGLLCGLGIWVHQGIVPMIIAALAAQCWRRRLSLRWVVWGVAGAVVGYLPAVVWRLGGHPILYRRTLIPWRPARVWENLVETISSDAWLLLADDSAAGVIAGATMLAFVLVAVRRMEWSRGPIVMAGTILMSLSFWILSNYPSAGAVRYIVPAVPLLYAIAALGIVEWGRAGGPRRVMAVVGAIVITAALYIPRYGEARDVEAGRAEQYADWPGGFDPRPTLQKIRAGGYRVCYGEAWVAHKLEWISEPTVRFVPVRIVHRTLSQSLGLIREPGAKCFVENDGDVRRLSAEEEARWRGSVVVRARKAGLTR